MKKIYYTFLILFCSLLAKAQFQFVSPAPNSKNLPVTHNIIIRDGREIDSSSLKSSIFHISGSRSGNHTFKVVLCKDGKTVNLNPDEPFAFDEMVSVSISRGLMTKEKKAVDSFFFNFSTRRKWTKEEDVKVRRINGLLEEREGLPLKLNDDTSGAFKVAGMFSITTNTTPAPGNIFFDCRSFTTPPSIYNSIDVISNSGDSIFQRTFSVFPYDFKILRNGYLETYQGNIEKFLVMDSNFAVIDTYMAANGYLGDAHELEILPNNNAFLIAGEVQFMILTGNTDSSEVLGTVIQEFDPDKNVIFEWRSFDHIDVEESEHVNFSIEPIDYIHTNSIEIDTDGNIIASHRHLDQVTKIDLSTGDFIWRLGGVNNEFAFINDPDRFSYQHDCRRLPNGNITLYDDGNFHIPSKSFAKEYQLDELNMTATLVWSYSHPDVNGIIAYYDGTGNVQRLSNGNTFIGWGRRTNSTLPSMTEVDSAGNIVWELKLSGNQNLVDYRAHKYEWNPCARPTFKLLTTTDITTHSAKLSWHAVANPSQVYEVQYKKHDELIWTSVKVNVAQLYLDLSDLTANTEYDWRIQSWCDTLAGDSSRYTSIDTFTTLLATSVEDSKQSQVALYPNPANDAVIISCKSPLSRIRILNLLGQEVKSLRVNKKIADQPFEVSVSDLLKGEYFVEVTYEGNSEIKKLTIQ